MDLYLEGLEIEQELDFEEYLEQFEEGWTNMGWDDWKLTRSLWKNSL